MVTIPNTFQAQTPIGQSISNLGTALFGNTLSPAEREKLRLANSLTQAKIGSEEAKAAGAQAALTGQRGIGDILGEALKFRDTLSAPDAAPGFIGPRLTERDQQFTDARTGLSRVPERLAQVGSFGVEDPQDLANLFNFVQASGRGVPDTDVLRSLAGRGKLPDENTAVSVAGQDRIAARNAELKPVRPGEPFTETNLLDTNSGQLIGVAFVDRTTGTAVDQDGQPVRLGPQPDGSNIVLAGKPTIQAATAGGLPGADDVELRNVRDDVFGKRERNSQALALVTELEKITRGDDAALAIGSLGRFSARLSGLRAQVENVFEREGVVIETDLNPERFKDQLQAIGAASAGAQSAIMDLAFSIATAREGGRLTDQDIARALQTLGGSQIDPALVRVALKRTAARIVRDDRITRQTAQDRFGTNPAAIPNITALQDLVSPFGASRDGETASRRIQFDASGNIIQ